MKAKIPLGKKPKGDDEESEEIDEERADSSQEDRTDATDISEMEEEDDEPQSKSLVYKLKKKIQSLQKKNVKLASKASSDDEEEEEEGGKDSDADKKKKKSKMLQIAIGGGLVLFLLSDYIIPTEEKVATPVLKPRKKNPKKQDTAATEEPKKEDAAATDTATAATDTSAATTETTPDSPVTVTSEDVPTDIPLETSPTETPPDTSVTEPVVEAPVETAPTETLPTDTVTTDTQVTEPSVDIPSSVDSVDGGETKTAGDESITDQILQDLEKQAKGSKPVEQKKEYVAPPDYEYRGRGLVYNCAGKHWACVDAPSYKTCEDNSSSVKYLNKKTECYPFNVYETPKGCENMQNRMVSSSAKTAFCSE